VLALLYLTCAKEFSQVNVSVLKSAFERVAINLRVKREDDSFCRPHAPSLHDCLPVQVREGQTLQRCHDLRAGRQRNNYCPIRLEQISVG
jgi:hypothetical protein